MKVYVVQEDHGWDGMQFILVADSFDAAVHHLLNEFRMSRSEVRVTHYPNATGGPMTTVSPIENRPFVDCWEITEQLLQTLDEEGE